LNVAVTRARMRIEVVSSILPGEIKDTGTQRSIHHLKKYLEYASERKNRMQVIATSFGTEAVDRESPFEDSVAHAIVRMGYEIESQLGCSGYRMDLAVKHPEDPSQFVLAVECDGAMYHSIKVVRDRDRLRQEILEGLGWRIHRIWSSAWYGNRKEQEKLLEVAIKSAIDEKPVIIKNAEIEIPKNDVKESDKNELDFGNDEPGKRPWLASYVLAKLDSNQFPIFQKLDDRLIWRDVEHAIMQVAKVEGPVHAEFVAKRIRDIWKTTLPTTAVKSLIQTYLDKMAGRGDVMMDSMGFIMHPESSIQVRAPLEGNIETERPLRLVSNWELGAAVDNLAEEGYSGLDAVFAVKSVFCFSDPVDEVAKRIKRL